MADGNETANVNEAPEPRLFIPEDEKRRAYEQQAVSAAGPVPLRERVERRRRRAAERSAHEHNDVLRLKELGMLLDRNPEVARILELLEVTGV